MAEVVSHVCDVDECGSTTGVECWTLTGEDGWIYDVDLCEKHSEPLRSAAAFGRKKRRPGRRPGWRDGLAQVKLKEPALRQPAAKAPRKRAQGAKPRRG